MAAISFAAYILRFKGPIHIGNCHDDYGTSLRYIASDTMYAAITATLAKMGLTIPPGGDLGCVISALFPFHQKNPDVFPTFFFPRPLSLSGSSDMSKNPERAKMLKRICWVDLHYLQKSITGENIYSSPSISNDIRGIFLTEDRIEGPIILSDVQERVAVSRTFEESKPFYMERIFFSRESGLFFMADGDTSQIDKALPLLAEEGIGTDRNIGNGFFSYEKMNIEISVPDEAEYGLLLSTFIPEDKPQLKGLLSGDSVAYDLERRGGWISTPPYLSFRKNAIYSFAPGSVLSGLSSGIGRIVDLSPKGIVPHPVWRCGKAFVLPLKPQR